MLTHFRFEVLHTQIISHTSEVKTLGRYFTGTAKMVGKLVNCNATGNVRITLHRGAFVQPLLRGKSKSTTYSECVFVVLGI